MDSIMAHEIWVLADLPISIKPIGCKWIFKKKLNSDGSIDKYKARLVLRVLKGLDYFDTLSLMFRMSTIRILIALAASHTVQSLGQVGDESAESETSRPSRIRLGPLRDESESRVGRLNSEETDSAKNRS